MTGVSFDRNLCVLVLCWVMTMIPSALGTPFLRAVKAGDLAKMTEEIRVSPETLNQADANGNTPLHWAARSGRANVVGLLLDRGAAVKVRNEAGATPLLNGAGHFEIVRSLIEAGADVNVVSKSQMTPLMAAAATPGALAAVRLLVEHGANINAQGRGLSPLSLAAANPELETVQYLVEQGAELAPKGGGVPLIVASWHGHREIVAWLLEQGADPNTGSFHAGHSLNMAFYGQHADVARLLVERGADLTHRSPNGTHGTPPMVWAAYHEGGDTSVAETMLGRGADVNIAALSGANALDWARARANAPLVNLLEEAGAKGSGLTRKEKAIPQRKVPAPGPERDRHLREAVQGAMDLLQRSSDGFLRNKGVRKSKCVSCHQQTLPGVAFGWAIRRGFKVDQAALANQLGMQLRSWKPRAESAFEMYRPQPNPAVLLGYGLECLSTFDYPADGITEGMTWFLAASQQSDGRFQSNDNRPPMEDGAIQGTAFALRALQLFPLPGRALESAERVRRASTWLQGCRPVTFNQKVFQVLGLAWAGEDSKVLEPYVEQILALQREDGGWSQLEGLAPDAWATGQALMALHEAGALKTDHEIYHRGVRFLLSTQFENGSWWVPSRTWPFQPHFDSGFPHGKDQWISAGGTAWACMALLLTQPETDALPQLDWKSIRDRPLDGTQEGDGPTELASAKRKHADPIDFVREVQPLLERSCVSCHSGDRPKGRFTLTTRQGFVKGGASGEPGMTPGHAEGSLFRCFVRCA